MNLPRPALLPLLAAALLVPRAAPAQDEAPRFEGALGLVASFAPTYGGAADSRWRLRPAGFIRYGRVTVSGAGGFTTRRDDDVERGVSAELVETDALRVSLSARWTNGRRESADAALTGLGDVQGTLLARWRLRWTPPGSPWTLGLGLNNDLLGKGSGWIADAGVSRQWALAPRTRLHFGSTLTFGSDTYMQSWYGVTAAQAQRSGYRVYTPGSGLRDLSADLTLRHEFEARWAGFVGMGVSRHVGDAARSPFVIEPLGWQFGGGLAWRF